MLDALLESLFPKRSLTGISGHWVTDCERDAWNACPTLKSSSLLHSLGMTALDHLAAAGNYDASPLLQKAIHRYKYVRVRHMGQELVSPLLAAVQLLRIPPHSMMLCPVPLHWTRRFWRGFNQSEVLARLLAQELGCQVFTGLQRIRPTGSQAHRSRQQRWTSLQGAFRSSVIPAHCTLVLIDDVCTTGATLQHCAVALRSAGAKHVSAAVLALG